MARRCQVAWGTGAPGLACLQQRAIVQLEPAIGNTAGMVESNVQSAIGDTGRVAGAVC